MRPSIRHGAFVLALFVVGIIAVADAQTTPPADDDVTGSVKSAHMLPLSDEQRWRIYEGVMQMPNARVAEIDPPASAEKLPHSVPMQDLPGSVEREVPMVKGHKFVKFDDRILVIDPVNRRVVVEIPRYKVMMQ